MNLWSCFEAKYIREFLDSSHHIESNFTIWQVLDNRRFQISAVIDSYDHQSVYFKVDPSDQNTAFSFKSGEKLFILNRAQDIIFRRDYFNYKAGMLKMTIPQEIRIKERRDKRRLTYKYQDHKRVDFRLTPFDANQFDEFDDEEEIDELMRVNEAFSGTLVDINREGLGMVLRRQDAGVLSGVEKVFITLITDQNLKEPHEAEVVYRSTYKLRNHDQDELIRFGVKFLQDFSSVNYQSIAKVMAQKQARIEGLTTDTYCGLEPEEQEKQLHNIGHKSKEMENALRDNLDYLDRIRYLTPKMKQDFLLETDVEMLSTALRMSTKEALYDLLSEVTTNMRNEFLERLETRQSPNQILKAQDEIISFVRSREARGEYVLDPKSYNENV